MFILNPSRFASASGGGTDPEAGLTLTRSFAEGEYINDSDVLKTSPAVFAVDITGLDGSSGGLVFELGAGALGAYTGFRSDGTFVCRAGDGSVLPDPNVAVVYATPGVIAGDGTLVFEFDVTSDSVRAWWNSVFIGAGGAANGMTTFAGGNDGGLFFKAFSMVDGEIDTPCPKTTTSALRYYESQTSSRTD